MKKESKPINDRIRNILKTGRVSYMDLFAAAEEQGNTDKLFWLRITCPHRECLRDIFLTFRVKDGDVKIEYSTDEPKDGGQ